MVNFLAICSIKNVNILIIEYYEIKWRIKKEDLKKYCSKKQLLKFQDQSLSVSFSCVHIACFFNLQRQAWVCMLQDRERISRAAWWAGGQPSCRRTARPWSIDTHPTEAVFVVTVWLCLQFGHNRRV